MSTLLHSGFSLDCLGQTNLDAIASYLEQHFDAQQGLLGFGNPC